jgi:hypothetical protein
MDIFFAIFSNEDNTPLNRTPMITGIVTIKNICDAILNNDCPSLIPPMSRTLNDIININGTVITHKILFIAVKDIERAIFPFANDVKTLLVTPPGAAARIITPIANSGDKGQNITIINATIGRTII